MSITGTKSINETKDYSIDWSKDIGSDIISSGGSTFTISPASATITQSSVASNGTLTTAWISAGVDEQVYDITNTIQTVSGRTLSKTIRVLVVGHNYL